MKYWEIIADNLSKAGWSWGCSYEIDSAACTGTQRTHTPLMVVGRLFWQTQGSARFWNLSESQVSRWARKDRA
jgi:hypothetical protein